jgi:hypothetical protein
VTCKLDPGVRAHVFWLQFGNDGATNPGQGLGTLAAQGMIGEIRVKWGGKIERQHTAVELNALNASPIWRTASETANPSADPTAD